MFNEDMVSVLQDEKVLGLDCMTVWRHLTLQLYISEGLNNVYFTSISKKNIVIYFAVLP